MLIYFDIFSHEKMMHMLGMIYNCLYIRKRTFIQSDTLYL